MSGDRLNSVLASIRLTPTGADAPDRPCDDVAAARGSVAALDGRINPKNTNHSDEERIELRRASGAFASRRSPLRAKGHWRAAARCGFLAGRRRQLGARAVGEAPFFIGLAGLSSTAVLAIGRCGSLAQRRVSAAWAAKRSGTVGAEGYSTLAPPIRLGCWVLERWARLERRADVIGPDRSGCPSPSRRLAGRSNGPGPFAHSCWAGLR